MVNNPQKINSKILLKQVIIIYKKNFCRKMLKKMIRFFLLSAKIFLDEKKEGIHNCKKIRCKQMVCGFAIGNGTDWYRIYLAPDFFIQYFDFATTG